MRKKNLGFRVVVKNLLKNVKKGGKIAEKGAEIRIDKEGIV